MMGAIVLSMLLSWFGAVTVLMILAGRARTATEALEALDARELREAAAEEPRRPTGGPRLATDDAQGGSSSL